MSDTIERRAVGHPRWVSGPRQRGPHHWMSRGSIPPFPRGGAGVAPGVAKPFEPARPREGDDE